MLGFHDDVSVGRILLEIWLILSGLLGFIKIGDITPIMNVLAPVREDPESNLIDELMVTFLCLSRYN